MASLNSTRLSNEKLHQHSSYFITKSKDLPPTFSKASIIDIKTVNNKNYILYDDHKIQKFSIKHLQIKLSNTGKMAVKTASFQDWLNMHKTTM